MNVSYACFFAKYKKIPKSAISRVRKKRSRDRIHSRHTLDLVIPSLPTTFGCLNREEVRHENGPPGGKSVPNPVWDRWIGHANHS